MAKFCTKCGAPNDNDDLFCVSCGSPLKPAPQPQPAPQEAATTYYPSAPVVPAAPAESKNFDNVALFKRKVGVCILLSFITLGIYAIYWQYLLVKNVRAIKGDDSSCTGEMLCLLFVPFYSLYWWFTKGDYVKKYLSDNGKYSSSSGALYLVLSIFGLSIVAAAIMQNDFNSIECAVITKKATLDNKLKVLRWVSICLFAVASVLVIILKEYRHCASVASRLLVLEYPIGRFSNQFAMLFVLLLPLLLLPLKKESKIWFVPGALISVLSILQIITGDYYDLRYIFPSSFSSFSHYLNLFLMCAGFTLISYCSFSRMRKGSVKPAFRLMALSVILLTIVISIIGAIHRIIDATYLLFYYYLPLFYFAVAGIGLLILYIDKKALIKRTWFIPGILVLVLITFNSIYSSTIGWVVRKLIIDIPLCAGFIIIGLWCKAYSDKLAVQSSAAVEPTATEATAE